MFIHIFPAFLISFTLAACAINRAPSLKMLEKRSDYDGSIRADEIMGQKQGALLSPVRTEPALSDIYIFPHEMPTGDYFLGGWIRTVISPPKWDMSDESAPLFQPKDKDGE